MCFNIICLHRSILRKLHSLNRTYVRGRTIKTTYFFASFEEMRLLFRASKIQIGIHGAGTQSLGGKCSLYPSASDNSQADLKYGFKLHVLKLYPKLLTRRHALSCILMVTIGVHSYLFWQMGVRWKLAINSWASAFWKSWKGFEKSMGLHCILSSYYAYTLTLCQVL